MELDTPLFMRSDGTVDTPLVNVDKSDCVANDKDCQSRCTFSSIYLHCNLCNAFLIGFSCSRSPLLEKAPKGSLKQVSEKHGLSDAAARKDIAK